MQFKVFWCFFSFYNKASLLLCSLPHRTFNITLGHKLCTRWTMIVTESSARKPCIAMGEWSRSGWKRDQGEGEDLGKCHSVSLLEKHIFMWKWALFILLVASGHACSHKTAYYGSKGWREVMPLHTSAPLGLTAKYHCWIAVPRALPEPSIKGCEGHAVSQDPRSHLGPHRETEPLKTKARQDLQKARAFLWIARKSSLITKT